jgi:hypothetical protein
MGTKKISELVEATSLNDDDLLPIVDTTNDSTKKITVGNAIGNFFGTETFSNESTYKVGDYCIYNNQLYRCIEPIVAAANWNSTKWIATTIKEELGEYYSENEVIYGTWINRKPIYKQTIEVDLGTSDATISINQTLNITNVENIIKMQYFSIKTASAGNDYDYGNFYISSTDRQRVFVHDENGTISLRIRAAISTRLYFKEIKSYIVLHKNNGLNLT